MAQSLSTICANPIRYYFGTTLSAMRDSEKIFFAIASICALGAVLCFFLSGALYGAKSFPFSAEVFLFSGIGSSAASGYLFYKVKQRTTLSQLSFISETDSSDILFPVEGILIEVDKGLIAETPVEHLYQLSIFLIEAMERGYGPNLNVSFSGQIGTDGGGLTKDFLDDLFSALVRHSELRFVHIENTSLKVPSCERHEETKREIFWRMGQVMAWCSRESHLIGRHFDPSIFSVAFSLTSMEMKIPLERFSFERKLELYRILLEAQQDLRECLQIK